MIVRILLIRPSRKDKQLKSTLYLKEVSARMEDVSECKQSKELCKLRSSLSDAEDGDINDVNLNGERNTACDFEDDMREGIRDDIRDGDDESLSMMESGSFLFSSTRSVISSSSFTTFSSQ